MTLIGFSPTSQIIDPKSGYLTRDGFMLVQFFVEAVNGAGAVLTVDGIQTLTNKTIDGDSNTFRGIPTSALGGTGSGDQVVTASEPGTTNYLALWSNGDLVDGPVAADVVTTSIGDGRYVSMDGSTITAGPINLASYTVATVPTASDFTGSIIYVSDETGGATPAFSDGTDWRRTADRAVIS